MDKRFYKDYEFIYYFRPGKSLNNEQNQEIFTNLINYNINSYNFKFGLFDPNISFSNVLKIFEDIILCLIYNKGEIVGFFYFFMLNDSEYVRPLIQLGLIVISKNTGHDIFSISEKLGLIYTYEKLGFFNSAIITTIPKIVEEFSITYSDTWPNPHKNLSRAPIEYKKYLTDVSEKYVKTFFPNPFTINKKRFTLILDKRESGFKDRYHYLPMARSFIFNAFCKSWINYEENEDLIVMGKYDFPALIRTKVFLLKIKIRDNLYSIIGKIYGRL